MSSLIREPVEFHSIVRARREAGCAIEQGDWTMTTQRKFKARVRERMAKTGESYTQALAATRHERGVEVSAPIAGWMIAGDAPRAYRFCVESSHEANEPVVRQARIECIDAKTLGFGTLMQSIDAAEYRGKRLRWSAEVRSESVLDRAVLWLRVDGRAREMLAYDNMNERPIRGTLGWARHDIVVDVDVASWGIAFGALLQGPGTIWFRRATFEVVSADVAVTARPMSERPKRPRNLLFEE